jgi:NADH-quinone oxidoreductase subunit N
MTLMFATQNLLAQSGAPAVQGVVPDVPWSLLHPVLIMVEAGILMITLTAVVPFLRRKGFPAAMTILAAALSFWRLGPVWNRVSEDGPLYIVGRAFAIDHFTLFIWGVIAIAVFIVAALLDGYLRREGLDGPEWYVLLLMSAVGGMILAASQELILTFVGLEILSIAVYVLAGLHLRRTESQEAAFKYFLLGALASALFLYGIALVYGATGSTSLEVIAGARAPVGNGLNPVEDSSLILGGMALILIGFGFKVSAVPFHLWTPDVYQGSPTPVVAFMASAVKVAGFAGLVRVFWQGFGFYLEDWRYPVIVMASLSLIVGSLLALPQTNTKRMLAFSSIAHAGFMLVAVQALASNDSAIAFRGAQALLYYLLAYTVMVAGTFGVMSLVGAGNAGRGDGAHSLDDYVGLSRRRPLLAGLLAVLLFAQAGIPFTSGFLAKFQVIVAAVDSGASVLAGVAMLSAVVAAVLYLRIVVSMFLVDEPEVALAATDATVAEAIDAADAADTVSGERAVDGPGIPMPWPAVTVIAMAAAASIWLGVMPIADDGVLAEAARALVELRN